MLTEQMKKAMQDHADELGRNAEKAKNDIYEVLPGSRIDELQRITSLKHWINLCDLLKIKSIPIELVGEISRKDIFCCLDGEKISKEAETFFLNVKEKVETDFMFRWECCAGHEIKYNLGTGKPDWKKEFNHLDIDDPRFIDIVFSTQRNLVQLWKRPWVQAEIYKNYPVEFRVFAKDGHIQGCTNYYPQRDLDDIRIVTKMSSWANAAMDISERFLKFEENFTADFLVTAGTEQELLFIEGGPPFGDGADPCCFDPNKDICGVALACQWEQRRKDLKL